MEFDLSQQSISTKDKALWLRGFERVEALFRPVSGRVLIFFGLVGLVTCFAIFGLGITFTSIFLNDTLVFFDGIDRLEQGQIPHEDFSTPVGALSYYLPYLGQRILGGYGGAVELASLVLCVFAIGISAALLWRRAGFGFSVLILIVVAGIIAVPIVPGWRAPDYSHAMHYNRWCWGLLTSLFLLALRPPIGGLSSTTTGLLGAALLLAMFFIKISFFLVGAAFLLLLFIYPDQRRREALFAAVGTVVGLGLVWFVQPNLMSGYLADILLALRSSDEMNRAYLDIALTNGRDLGLLALALVVGLFGKGGGWRDYLVFGFIVSSGIAIIGQNFQFVHIATFTSAFALLATNLDTQKFGGKVAHTIILVAALVMIIPFAKEWARTAVRFTQHPDIAQFAQLDDARFGSMYVTDRKHFSKNPPQIFDHSDAEASEYLTRGLPVSNLTETGYVAALNDAVRLIEENDARGRPILTLDFTNAVPLLVDAPRVSGGYSWIHLGRNVSQETLPEGSEMFAGYEFVIVPLGSLTAQKTQELISLFGPYLAAKSDIVARSDNWLLLRLR